MLSILLILFSPCDFSETISPSIASPSNSALKEKIMLVRVMVSYFGMPFLVKKFMKYHNIKDDIVRILTDISNKHHNLFRQTIMPHIHPTECRLALLSLHKGVTFQTLVLRVQQDSDLLEQI